MSYENYVLFAWLYESGGAARFRHFLGQVGEAGPHEHRAAAEAAFAPEVWQDFVQTYIDQRLHFPGGEPLNSTPVLTPEHDASAETPIAFRALPLVLARASIRVEPGRYRFATTVTHGPYAASQEAGAWAPLPERLETPCDGDRVIKLAAITMSNDGVQVEIRPTREGEAACSCTAPNSVAELLPGRDMELPRPRGFLRRLHRPPRRPRRGAGVHARHGSSDILARRHGRVAIHRHARRGAVEPYHDDGDQAER